MTPSQQAKEAGLKSLTQMSQMTGKPTDTLRNWHRDSPDLFRLLLAGCVIEINRSKEEELIMKEENELLRSAYQIAKRQGSDTNWNAFLSKLEAELVKQAKGDRDNPQHIDRATCTARTYRLPVGM
jgi:hypothetical protein